MTRRSGFRFNGFLLPVTFKTAYEEGTASLTNISTSGCALQSLTIPLTIQETFLITINLEEQQNAIEAQAVVVRYTEKGIAAQFTIIEQTSQTTLRRYFCQKLRDHP